MCVCESVCTESLFDAVVTAFIVFYRLIGVCVCVCVVVVAGKLHRVPVNGDIFEIETRYCDLTYIARGAYGSVCVAHDTVSVSVCLFLSPFSFSVGVRVSQSSLLFSPSFCHSVILSFCYSVAVSLSFLLPHFPRVPSL